MTDVTITKEKTDARHGRYVARIAGVDAEAELTFTRHGPDRVSADHTGASEALRGTELVVLREALPAQPLELSQPRLRNSRPPPARPPRARHR